MTHIFYAAGPPDAVLLGIVVKLGTQSVFAARALEEVLKTFVFLLRYRTRLASEVDEQDRPGVF